MSAKTGVSRDRAIVFAEGFALGHVSVYCEQVAAGSKLAAQMGIDSRWVDYVCDYVRGAGLRSLIGSRRSEDRTSVWIFKYQFVEKIIQSLSSDEDPVKETGVWSMGKLFGYSDAEIARFLGENGLS